jgi:Ca2+-binding RTX toxin-like protein
MKLDESKPYTFKTQHLANVTARGSNEVNLVGNGHDNELTGNSGNNVLTGSAGEDQIDGGEGEDTAVFSGDSEEYKVSTEGDVTIVSDQVAERDGIDKLRNVEFTQFGDQKIRVD